MNVGVSLPTVGPIGEREFVLQIEWLGSDVQSIIA
jgi:hypothetical protein